MDEIHGLGLDSDEFLALQRRLGEAFAPFVNRLRPAFDGLDVEGLRHSAEFMTENGRRIGAAGWTFPIDATPRETADMLRQAESEGIDAIFLRYTRKMEETTTRR